MVLCVGFSVTFYYASVSDIAQDSKGPATSLGEAEIKNKFPDGLPDAYSIDEVFKMKVNAFRADLQYRF
jgi:hypothetical protein